MKNLYKTLLLFATFVMITSEEISAQKPDFEIIEISLVTDIWDTTHQNILYPNVNEIFIFMRIRNDGPVLDVGDTLTIAIAEPQGPTHFRSIVLPEQFGTNETKKITIGKYNVVSVLIDYSFCAAVYFASNGYQLKEAEWYQKMKCAKSVTWDVTGIGSFETEGGAVYFDGNQIAVKGGSTNLLGMEVEVYSIGGQLITKEKIAQLNPGELHLLRSEINSSGLYIATIKTADGSVSRFKLMK